MIVHAIQLMIYVNDDGELCCESVSVPEELREQKVTNADIGKLLSIMADDFENGQVTIQDES